VSVYPEEMMSQLSKFNEKGSITAGEEKKKHIGALDFMRALAIMNIVLYHYYMEWYHGSFLIVPEGIVPNLARLQLFNDGGVIGLIKNLFSFLFVYGFTSVNLFLLLSGFVLSYGLLSKQSEVNWLVFLLKRIKRIFVPFYVSVLLGVGFLFLRNLVFPAIAAPPIYNWLDGLKIMFFPFAFYDIQFLQRFNGDYWFIPLILQLYLLFPLLFIALNKWGPERFLAGVFVLTVLYRLVAAYYLDTVPMGVIFPTANSYRLFSFFLPRLFEFGLGMALAWWQVKLGNFIERAGRNWRVLVGFVLAFSGGLLNSYRWGWIFSDLAVAAGLFFLFLGIVNLIRPVGLAAKLLSKVSGASYEIYLLHHYFLNYFLLPFLLTAGIKNETVFWLVMPVYLVIAVWIGEGGRRLSKLVELGFSWLRLEKQA